MASAPSAARPRAAHPARDLCLAPGRTIDAPVTEGGRYGRMFPDLPAASFDDDRLLALGMAGGVCDGGMLVQDGLDLRRVDVLAAPNDEVLAASLEVHELVDDVAVVAGAVPALVVEHLARRFGVVPVSEEQCSHPHADLADLTIGQCLAGCGVADFEFGGR